MSDLSPSCREVQAKLLHVEAMALDVMPVVQDACGKELKLACATVQPGEGRLFECLLKHQTAPDVSVSKKCLAAIHTQQVSLIRPEKCYCILKILVWCLLRGARVSKHVTC